MKNGFGPRCCMMGTLLALLVLLLASPPSTCAQAKPLNTIVLVARRGLTNPFFGHSIVLVLNDLGSGPVGIITNRPTPVLVSSLFPRMKRLARLNDKVYFGGPVDLRTVWFLFRAKTSPRHAIRVLAGVYLSADSKLLSRLIARRRPMRGLRIYVGHAGWAPEQLRAEIAAGYWTLKKADAETVFGHESEYPWPSPETRAHGAERTVARSAPGTDLVVGRSSAR